MAEPIQQTPSPELQALRRIEMLLSDIMNLLKEQREDAAQESRAARRSRHAAA